MIQTEAKRKWNGRLDGKIGGGKSSHMILKARQKRNGERTEPSSNPGYE
jgi:hypothetical protein